MNQKEKEKQRFFLKKMKTHFPGRLETDKFINRVGHNETTYHTYFSYTLLCSTVVYCTNLLRIEDSMYTQKKIEKEAGGDDTAIR